MIDKPGPELDIRIAEAFEWKYAGTTGGILVRTPLGDIEPNFSITWEGMRLVVEEMQRRGWSFTLQRYGDDNGEKSPWEATFGFVGDEPGAIEDTAPHAVCMASLKALEDSQNE